FTLILFLIHWYRQKHEIEIASLLLVGGCLVVATVLGSRPEYFSAFGFSALIHRSIAAALLLTPLGLVSTSAMLYISLGGTPRAEDVARYPLIGVPAAFALGMYGWLLYALVVRAVPQFQLALIFQPYLYTPIPTQTIAANGQVTQGLHIVIQAGFSNQLIGTCIWMGATPLISLPIGVGTGIYVAEYAQGRAAQLVRFSTTALRGISVFTLGVTAVSLVNLAKATPLALVFTGYHYDSRGVLFP